MRGLRNLLRRGKENKAAGLASSDLYSTDGDIGMKVVAEAINPLLEYVQFPKSV